MAMNRMISKSLVTVSLTTAVLLSGITSGAVAYSAAQTSAPVQFQIGSNQVTDYRGVHTLAAAPYVLNGIAMVPVRALAEGLQATIEWDAEAKEILLSREGLTVHLTQDSDEITGTYIKNVKLPAKTANVRGNVFVPGKLVAQLLGAQTTWDAKQKKVSIQTSETALSTV